MPTDPSQRCAGYPEPAIVATRLIQPGIEHNLATRPDDFLKTAEDLVHSETELIEFCARVGLLVHEHAVGDEPANTDDEGNQGKDDQPLPTPG